MQTDRPRGCVCLGLVAHSLRSFPDGPGGVCLAVHLPPRCTLGQTASREQQARGQVNGFWRADRDPGWGGRRGRQGRDGACSGRRCAAVKQLDSCRYAACGDRVSRAPRHRAGAGPHHSGQELCWSRWKGGAGDYSCHVGIRQAIPHQQSQSPGRHGLADDAHERLGQSGLLALCLVRQAGGGAAFRPDRFRLLCLGVLCDGALLRRAAAAEHRRRAAKPHTVWARCAGPDICGRLRLHPGLGRGLCAARAGLRPACAAFARAAASVCGRGRAVRAPLLQPLLRPVMDPGERDCLDRAVRRRDVHSATPPPPRGGGGGEGPRSRRQY